jgi:hypothetical protein
VSGTRKAPAPVQQAKTAGPQMTQVRFCWFLAQALGTGNNGGIQIEDDRFERPALRKERTFTKGRGNLEFRALSFMHTNHTDSYEKECRSPRAARKQVVD